MSLGTLYIVATPIGNMQDISLRAVEVLKNVDAVLSEDTRETQKILDSIKINKSQYSYRDQNHERIIGKIQEMLDQGKNLALVSDNGTPLISDPGFKLVRDLADKNYTIVAVPGPSAAIAALSISGLPTDAFLFTGFLPKTGKRKQILMDYKDFPVTLTIYESPYRIGRLLDEVYEIMGDRKICVVKDITKKYEQVWRGKITNVIPQIPKATKGEFVVMVAKKDF